MNPRTSLAIVLASLLAACGSTGAKSAHEPTPGSGLNLGEMDLSADPARDFYRYVNGGWLDANPVPSDESSFGVFHEIDRRNEVVLKEILEESAKKPKDELHAKLGSFYATGMDEAAIEAQGARPLAEELAAIDALADTAGLPELLARLHPLGAGGPFATSV